MTKYWIASTFVHSDQDYLIEKAERYFEPGLWGIENRFVESCRLEKGDRLLFYVGGTGARFFVGIAEVAEKN